MGGKNVQVARRGEAQKCVQIAIKNQEKSGHATKILFVHPNNGPHPVFFQTARNTPRRTLILRLPLILKRTRVFVLYYPD